MFHIWLVRLKINNWKKSWRTARITQLVLLAVKDIRLLDFFSKKKVSNTIPRRSYSSIIAKYLTLDIKSI